MLQKKWLWVLLASIIILALGIFFSKDLIAENFVYAWIQDNLGIKAVTGSMKTGLLMDSFEIENMDLTNPEKPEEILAKIVTIQGLYELPTLFQEKVHFTNLDLHIKQIEVVKKGNNNIHFSHLQPKTVNNLTADEVSITIDNIIFTDKTVSNPRSRIIPVNINGETYTDILNLQDLALLMETRIIEKANLIHKDTKEQQAKKTGLLKRFKSGVKRTTYKVKRFFKKVFKKKKN